MQYLNSIPNVASIDTIEQNERNPNMYDKKVYEKINVYGRHPNMYDKNS